MKNIIILISLITAFACSNNDENERLYPAGQFPDRITRSITEDPSTQIAISYRTNNSINKSYIEYLPSTPYLGYEEAVIRKEAICVPVEFQNITDHYFQVELDDLKPDTKYQLRVGSNDNFSEWFTISTAPENFQDFYFLHFAGVQHEINSYAARIYREAYKNHTDAKFMLHSGDIVQARGGDNNWGDFLKSGSWMFSEIPLAVAAGNSDHWEVKNESVFKRTLYPQWNSVFNLPKNHPQELQNLAYYFDYPGVRVITLYSGLQAAKADRPTFINKNTQMTEELFFKQVQWLEKTLKENTQPWSVVQIHHPILTAREGRDYKMHNDFIRPVLEKYSVDLVLQGHEHLYARGKSPNSNKPVYITSMAGPRNKKTDHSRDWIEKSAENMQLFQVIFVTKKSLKVQVFNLNNQIIDEIVINK